MPSGRRAAPTPSAPCVPASERERCVSAESRSAWRARTVQTRVPKRGGGGVPWPPLTRRSTPRARGPDAAAAPPPPPPAPRCAERREKGEGMVQPGLTARTAVAVGTHSLRLVELRGARRRSRAVLSAQGGLLGIFLRLRQALAEPAHAGSTRVSVHRCAARCAGAGAHSLFSSSTVCSWRLSLKCSACGKKGRRPRAAVSRGPRASVAGRTDLQAEETVLVVRAQRGGWRGQRGRGGGALRRRTSGRPRLH